MTEKLKTDLPSTDNSFTDLLGTLLRPVTNILLNIIDRVTIPIQRRIGSDNMGYLFLLPNILIFGIFVLFPMLLNFRYAMTSGTNIFLAERPFVGLENFRTLFECGSYLDPNSCTEDFFWRAIYNTFSFVFFNVVGVVFFSLTTALVLNQNIKARGFFRSVFFYPVLLSPVVVGFIWRWIIRQNGLLNAIIEPILGSRITFLTDPDWALFWVIFVSIWATMGFYTLILLAGLQSIPGSLYEASSMDGASPWDNLRFITLPLLMPTMFVVLVLALIRAVQVFDIPFVLTGGGPGTSTTFMVQYIYETGFSTPPRIFGLASAASVILGIALLIFTMIQLRIGNDSSLA